MKSRRPLGNTPSEEDLALVVFSHANRFQADEKVLVPRSRGGFVYGKIIHGKKRNTCYVDAKVSHTLIDWRVEYPNADGRTMFKQQPCALVGKFPSSGSSPSPLSTSQSRQLGTMASIRDLSNVLFNPLSKFEVGETVLVARSSGGFTYGELIAHMPVQCMAPLDRESRHPVTGWRIALDDKKSMKKELPTVLIGKIPLCGAISEVIPPPYEPVSSAKKKRKRSRNRKGRGKHSNRSRRPDRTPNLTPAAPIGVLNPSERAEDEEEEDEYEEDSEGEYDEEDEEEGEYDEEDEEEEDEEDSDSEIILFRPPGAEPVEAPAHEEEEEDEDSEEILVQARPGNGGILQIPGASSLLANEPKQTTAPPAARVIPPAAQAPPRRPQGSGKLTLPPNSKCLVVIDAPNVAMKHGNRTFSTKGITLCVEYYQKRGHEVVAFLPEHYVNGKKTPGANGVTLSDYYNPKVDNMTLIDRLVRDEILFFTPPQDYDDSYCIQYAKQNGGIIVTNDMYRDHIQQFQEPQRGRVKRWIREHVCSFTFVKDTFMPNPDFKFP